MDATARLAHTVHQAAQLMGVSQWEVRRLIASGKLERVNTGDRRVLVTAESLNRLTNAGHTDEDARGRPVAWLTPEGLLSIDLRALGVDPVQALPALPLLQGGGRAQRSAARPAAPDDRVRPLLPRARR